MEPSSLPFQTSINSRNGPHPQRTKGLGDRLAILEPPSMKGSSTNSTEVAYASTDKITELKEAIAQKQAENAKLEEENLTLERIISNKKRRLKDILTTVAKFGTVDYNKRIREIEISMRKLDKQMEIVKNSRYDIRSMELEREGVQQSVQQLIDGLATVGQIKQKPTPLQCIQSGETFAEYTKACCEAVNRRFNAANQTLREQSEKLHRTEGRLSTLSPEVESIIHSLGNSFLEYMNSLE